MFRYVNVQSRVPRPFYVWRIAWALALTQTVGYSVLYYDFAVFVKPMEAEFGWGRAETSGAFSLALLAAVAISRMAASAMGEHLVPLLLERGLTSGLAAAAGSVGLMQLGRCLFFTPQASRVSLPILSTLTFALHALALLVLLALSALAEAAPLHPPSP